MTAQYLFSKTTALALAIALLFAGTILPGCERDTGGKEAQAPSAVSSTEDASRDSADRSSEAGPTAGKRGRAMTEMTEQELEDLVSQSYRFVAMYNVNNKFAASQGGWDTCDADTELKDHTMRDIARPNNDTLYISCLLDLRQEPVVLEVPPFDSEYTSLMVTGYDHYVNVPLSTRKGDFQKPQKILLYSERTEGYGGEPVQGVDHVFETTGDFISAVFRVMPHSSDKEKFTRITEQMRSVKAVPLSEFLGKPPKPPEPANFPAVGETDADVFADNLLEVMQFVFNHTTFDPNNPEDKAVLALYKPLGVEPGKTFDRDTVAKLNGEELRAKAKEIQQKWLANSTDETLMARLQPKMFQPKGEADAETLLVVSVIGPIGLPQEEAVYPQLSTDNGEPMNALHDYVIRMDKDELPPAGAFWSLPLYDLENGFFIPNERKKYSVGKNAGMKLNKDGGIEIYIAADKPEGVPEENWLPIERKDMLLSPTLRIYVPDLEKMKTWRAPKAERLD